MLVELLETVGGDGIDFDWEHLSEYKGVDAALHAQQRQDRVGGIMFWAANEAAVSSLNGKTTGENSGTLAAYAAGLVA